MKKPKETQSATRTVEPIRAPEPAKAEPKEPKEPKVEAAEEPKGILALFDAISCAACQRRLVAAFSSKGKLQLQHDRSDCIHAGKHFELPTVTLHEAKP